MTTTVSQKIPNPTWTPTPNIRKHYLAQGVTLPSVVPAGPENPMGLFALRLAAGRGEYLIHGTNANFGIGMRVSSGCIRLRPDDIQALFSTVPKGTRVQIVNKPVKYAIEPDGKRYLEVHQPLSRVDSDDPQTMPIAISSSLQSFINDSQTDAHVVHNAIVRRAGMPIIVTVGETSPLQIHADVAPQGEQHEHPADGAGLKLFQPGPVYSAVN
jgi:L,D-transpeptidase YcfS